MIDLPAELLTHYIYQAISCLIIELLIKTKAFVSPIESQTALTELKAITQRRKQKCTVQNINIPPISRPFPLPRIVQYTQFSGFSQGFVITIITTLQ